MRAAHALRVAALAVSSLGSAVAAADPATAARGAVNALAFVALEDGDTFGVSPAQDIRVRR